MSAIFSPSSVAGASPAAGLHFGRESLVDGRSVEWLLKRNCSLAPRQMLAFFGSVCFVSLGIGCFFWMQGLPLVLPFAGAEIAALAAASLLYARHATDRESIQLRPGSLVVEHAFGRHVERVEFAPAWVCVEPEHGDRSLVELSGQGRRISVGRFVRPELRRQLADELRWALRRWQGLVRPAPVSDAPQADKSET